VEAIELRRAALRANLDVLAGPDPGAAGDRQDRHLRGVLARLRWPSRFLPVP
jgi:hypothetical protein